MMTAIKLGVNLYLVGVVSLTGMLVWYLSRTPPAARVPRAGWVSAFMASLLWPVLVLALIWGRVRAYRASRRVRRALQAAGYTTDGSTRRRIP